LNGTRVRLCAVLLAGAIAAGACGSDSETSSPTTAEATSTTRATTSTSVGWFDENGREALDDWGASYITYHETLQAAEPVIASGLLTMDELLPLRTAAGQLAQDSGVLAATLQSQSDDAGPDGPSAAVFAGDLLQLRVAMDTLSACIDLLPCANAVAVALEPAQAAQRSLEDFAERMGTRA
jgi:hypothetical protein